MHKHSVYDVDSHYRIDPTSRKIVNESSSKLNLMQYDHNSERFTFEIPREIEGHDMMDCNMVEVHYLNVDSTADTVVEGVYDVTDMQLSPEDDSVVIFSWLISANATQFVGLLQFLIRFACVAEDGTIDYAWHTDIYEKIKISKGINNSDSVYMQYADVLHQWKQEISNIVNGGGGGTGGGNGTGADGYSPTVNVTNIEGGHRVTVTDAKGAKSFDVMDGAKGDTGERGVAGIVVSETEPLPDAEGNHPVWVNPNGDEFEIDKDDYTPVKGVDYWTNEDKLEIVQDVLSQIIIGDVDAEIQSTLPSGLMYGDVNMDGFITEDDYNLVHDHVLGVGVITDATALTLADLDGDGSVSTMDYKVLKRIYLQSEQTTGYRGDYLGNWSVSDDWGTDFSKRFYVDIEAPAVTTTAKGVITNIEGATEANGFKVELHNGFVRVYAKNIPLTELPINVYYEDGGDYVPVKGVDYWTEEDKAEIVQELLSQVVDGNEVSY